MNKIALITGATSGIGQATALKAAEAGFDVIITGRRNDRLQELAESIRQKGADVLPLAFDIRQSGEVETAIRNLGGKWRDISVLVNNAGLAVGVAPIQEGVLDDWERMIDTNVKGLLYITRAVAPPDDRPEYGSHRESGLHRRKRSISRRKRVLCNQTCRGCLVQGYADRYAETSY